MRQLPKASHRLHKLLEVSTERELLLRQRLRSNIKCVKIWNEKQQYYATSPSVVNFLGKKFLVAIYTQHLIVKSCKFLIFD